MSALQKLKAYFGMVPADDMDGYDEDGRYVADYRDDYDDRNRDDRSAVGGDYDRYSSGRRRSADSTLSARSTYRADYDEDGYELPEDRPRGRRSWATEAPTHGALAVEPKHEPVTRLRPAQDPVAHPLAKIITLHPRSYTEARTIGEHYRDGTPVIINLTDMDNADAKRLVDFAAGLIFGLRGTIERVTSKVFLLSPQNVTVTAEDKERIAAGGFFNQS
jgi:cell division inhibitor SepF